MPAATAAALPPDESAGNTPGVAGIEGGAERRVLGGCPHPELVHVGLADDRCTGVFQEADHMGIIGGNVPFEDLRGAGGLDPLCGDIVLDRNGDTGKFALAMGGPCCRLVRNALYRSFGSKEIVCAATTSPAAP